MMTAKKTSGITRREMLKTTAVFGLGALAAACAPKTSAPSGEEQGVQDTPAPAEKAKITFWWEAGEESYKFNDTLIDPFNAQSTDAEVEFVTKVNVVDAVRPALAAGTGPDVFPTHGPAYTAELAGANLVLDMNSYAETYNWKDRFQEWALNIGAINGKLYSLPCELETVILWMNKTVFDKNGWKAPKTIDELIALCESIAKTDVIPFGGQAGECKPCNEWYFGEYTNHIAMPQKCYDAFMGNIKWNDDAFVEAMTIQADVVKKGWIDGGVERFLAATFDEFRAMFASGKAAMNMEGTWLQGDMKTLFGPDSVDKNDWDWVPFPSKTGDPVFDIGIGSSWSVNAATKYPQQSCEFLDFVFTPDIQSKFLTVLGLAPAPIKLKASEIPGYDPKLAKIYEEFSKAADSGNYGYTPWTFLPPKSDVYVYEELEKVWTDNITVKDYLDGLSTLFDEELKDGKVPPIPKRS